MNLINLNQVAEKSALSWRSTIVAQTANANLKVLRMDAAEYAAEVHDYDEILLVLTGCMKLHIAGATVTVKDGEMYLVAAGLAHAVAAGSYGTLLILDPSATSPQSDRTCTS